MDGAPLIGNLLASLLGLALLYLFYYSFELRSIQPGTECETLLRRPQPAPPLDPAVLNDFFIEPSPIPGQRIPYPTISDIPASLDFSVVLLNRNSIPDILSLLTSISQYFDTQTTYEILLVDVASDDGARADALDFANSHPQIRVLHIPWAVSLASACRIGILRTRGNRVFLFDQRDNFPIQVLDLYRAQTGGLVVGQWQKAADDFTVLRSTLSRCLETCTEKVLVLSHLRSGFEQHSLSFLITRDVAQIVYSAPKSETDAYDVELLVVAAISGIDLRLAELESPDPLRYRWSSLERLEQLRVAIQSWLLHVCRLNRLKPLPHWRWPRFSICKKS
jgi:hypothetical protein